MEALICPSKLRIVTYSAAERCRSKTHGSTAIVRQGAGHGVCAVSGQTKPNRLGGEYQIWWTQQKGRRQFFSLVCPNARRAHQARSDHSGSSGDPAGKWVGREEA